MTNDVCWIDSVGEDDADDALKAIYDRIRNPHGGLDNLYRSFSLMPHTIQPADDLYRAVLHAPENQLPKHFSELIGTYVAILAGCDYASTHHGHNYRYLMGDRKRAGEVLGHLRAGNLDVCGDAREVSALRYVRKLCLEPHRMSAEDVHALSANAWSDTEILEIVQVAATFGYFVRVINGVGVSLKSERIGLY